MRGQSLRRGALSLIDLGEEDGNLKIQTDVF